MSILHTIWITFIYLLFSHWIFSLPEKCPYSDLFWSVFSYRMREHMDQNNMDQNNNIQKLFARVFKRNIPQNYGIFYKNI